MLFVNEYGHLKKDYPKKVLNVLGVRFKNPDDLAFVNSPGALGYLEKRINFIVK